MVAKQRRRRAKSMLQRTLKYFNALKQKQSSCPPLWRNLCVHQLFVNSTPLIYGGMENRELSGAYKGQSITPPKMFQFLYPQNVCTKEISLKCYRISLEWVKGGEEKKKQNVIHGVWSLNAKWRI